MTCLMLHGGDVRPAPWHRVGNPGERRMSSHGTSPLGHEHDLKLTRDPPYTVFY